MPKVLSLAVVMDPIAKIKFAKDSTLAMLLAASARGWKLMYFEQSDLFLRDGIAFGHGRHLCLGANLARLELTIMIERFAAAFAEFHVDPAHAPTWKPRGDVRALSSLHLLAGNG